MTGMQQNSDAASRQQWVLLPVISCMYAVPT